jgi:hypothetical protein
LNLSVCIDAHGCGPAPVHCDLNPVGSSGRAGHMVR